jgi:shikimate kinase
MVYAMEGILYKYGMSDLVTHNDAVDGRAAMLGAALGHRSVVLVGIMGAGKSSIGRRLASRLSIPFVDADNEIEKAAGMTIPEIFANHGETYFRAGEARVIARLLESGPQVLATGGGAFMNPETRAIIKDKAISVWLRATLDVLSRRIKRRTDRPLLKTEDPVATLKRLIDERYPIYAEADFTIESRDVPHDVIVDEIVTGLRDRIPLPDGAADRDAGALP